jgi:hypothetical protein
MRPIPPTGSLFSRGLTVGPDDTVYVLADGPGGLVTAVNSDGQIVATVSSANGTVAGPIVFSDDGTGYVTVVRGILTAGTATTTVWAITSAGSTEVTTVPGSDASGAGGLSIAQNGDVLLTTVNVDESLNLTTQVRVLPGVSPSSNLV